MTHRSTWKKMEGRVAKKFGTTRNPLSGRNAKHSASDSLSDTYYIECKYKAQVPFMATFNEAKANAKKEGKIPIVVFKQKGMTGEIAMLSLDDLIKMMENGKS